MLYIGNYSYLCINSTRHASHRTAYQGESFAFIGMKYTKLPITLPDQIHLSLSEKFE